MSPDRKKLAILLGLILVATPLTAWALGMFQRTAPEAEGTGLLPRAIEALGGRDRLSRIRSLAIEATGDEHGRPMTVKLAVRFPASYRQDVNTVGANVVHAIDGETAWATLDGALVPLEKPEVARIRDQIALQRLALLVGAEGSDDLKLEVLGPRDGLEWLEARIKGSASGPYAMGFDPETSLLSRAEWRTTIAGHRDPQTVNARFSDYRRVDGIMVPYVATYSVGDQSLGRTHIESVHFNPEFDAESFRAPRAPATPVIMRRTTPEIRALLQDVANDEAKDAEQVLKRFAEEFGHDRNGPEFRLVEANTGRVTTVGLPVEAVPPSTPVTEQVPMRPRIETLPPTDVLTTVVIEADDETLAAARARLTAHARVLGLTLDGPFRHVTWNADIVQVQVPVRAREGKK